MTLIEFKTILKLKKKGDIRIPETNEELKPLIQESLEYIAKNCIPTDLVTTDTTVDTLRWLNSAQLTRKPIATITDEEEIDIDEELTYAVIYDVLANRTADLTKASFFTSKRDEEINTYRWNNFQFLQELGLV